MDVKLEQLIQAIKQLPVKQFAKLKAEINSATPEKADKQAFKAFLLQAPVYTDDQINLIGEARKSMNKWGQR